MRLIQEKRKSKLLNTISKHIKDNIKAYCIVGFILIIGIILGVSFINNMQENQSNEVKGYINNFINNVKEDKNIDTSLLFKKSITNNFLLVLFMWFVGSTIIGMPLVLGMVLFRGFCLGYTISALIAVLGSQNGILFCITAILLQNIIVIPCIMTLAVSGIKLYKSIIRDRRRENIKLEVLTHTLISIIMLILLIGASFIESYLSTNLFQICIKNF